MTETEARLEIGALREALRQAEHALITMQGLTASDGLGAYSEALYEGLEHHVAWDCFVEDTWKIDDSKVMAVIEAALATEPPDPDAVIDWWLPTKECDFDKHVYHDAQRCGGCVSGTVFRVEKGSDDG